MYGCFRLKKVLTILLLIVFMLGAFGYVRYLVPQGIVLTVATPNEGVLVPIIMYHSVYENPAQAGDYEITPQTLEADMRYLQEHGYTPIFVTELIAYVYNDVSLPEKPVILSFDDGYYNNLTEVLPLLEKYDMKAIVSVVGSFSDRSTAEEQQNPAYSYLTWDNMTELSVSNRVEVGNHSYNMHSLESSRRGTLKKWGESDEQYADAFTKDISKLQGKIKESINYAPVTFAYPYGFISKESVPLLKDMGFKAALSSYEKPNYITKDPELLYHLNRYNRPYNISTDKFMKKALAP